MSATEMLANLSNVALGQFVVLYDAVAEKKGLSRPSSQELLEWLKDEMMILDKAMISSMENRIDPIKQVEAPEPQEVEVPSSKKVPVKDLKKLTYKQTRTIQKGEKQGEIIEEDILFELPYLPHCVDYSKGCQAIRVNGGLMTPCLTRPSKGSLYCKGCQKEGLKYGTIEGREKVPIGTYQVEVDGKDKTITKKEISYGTWLSKRNVERSFVEKLIADHGLDIDIPESYYKIEKSKAKRSTKRSPSVSSDGETSSVEEETASVESVADPVVEPVVEPVADPVVEPEAEVPTQTKKEHALEVALKVSEQVANAEPEKKKSRGRPKKNKEEGSENNETPKKRRGRPKKESKPLVDEETSSVEGSVEENAVVEEQTKAIEEPAQSNDAQVTTTDEEGNTHFVFNGKKYLYDAEYTIILNDESDELAIVGTWDPEENVPNFDSDYQP